MSDCITVSGIRAYGKHGVGDERSRPQPVVVGVELDCDLSPAVAADDLAKTIDYDRVTEVVREVVERESFELIEALANAVAARLQELGASSVRVSVAKPWAAKSLGVSEVSVSVERRST